ncbi:MAG: ATP-dependent 6-phosphofructokinase 1 [Owenweeksia sp. TMED14]|nr:MAG: ATP-dependent 6-phosphofructokinase 1 [Owenweeksia sp. TMED14]|tara:strand:- start:21460 stop:22437 length:978 start_codon:yes stop_codon:yes gene_type:complete
MSKKNIAVLTSGGDSPGMNAIIRAVVRTCVFYDKNVFGVIRGYDGLMEGDFMSMNARSVKGILSQGGTILKSARSDFFRTIEGRKKAAINLKSKKIDGLIVIGGDGTLTGAHLLNEEHGIPVIGIPGTIDNDLFGTDSTIGFDTACNTVKSCIDKIRDTANSHNRLFIVEVMGRDAGFIALNSGVSTGALEIVLPEMNTSIDELLESVERGAKNKKTSNIIVVAEGNRLGSPFEISKSIISRYPKIDVKVTILGHVQRGGSPSSLDRVNASILGVAAVEGLLNGKSDVMVGLVNNHLEYTFLQQAIFNKAPLNMELHRIAKILSI